jgi:hypothetical protein
VKEPAAILISEGHGRRLRCAAVIQKSTKPASCILTGWFMKRCCVRAAVPAAVVECWAISFALSHSQLIRDEIPEQTHQGKILLNESEARI